MSEEFREWWGRSGPVLTPTGFRLQAECVDDKRRASEDYEAGYLAGLETARDDLLQELGMSEDRAAMLRQRIAS